MFISKFASNVLNSIDNAAKESLEEPKQLTATQIRSQRRNQKPSDSINDNTSRKIDDSQVGDIEADDSGISVSNRMKSNGDGRDSLSVVTSRQHISANDLINHPSNSTTFNILSSSSSTINNDTTSFVEGSESTASMLTSSRLGLAQPQEAMASGNNLNDNANTSQRSNSTIKSTDSNVIDSDLKKTLMKRNKEIEGLNGECLEFEDQVQALKREVQEAWGSYKSSQEKAAVREAELQDELRLVQKAKSTDKQSLLQQMGRVGEEVDGALKQMRQMQGERDALQNQLRTMMDSSAQWEAREAALEGQLKEARAGSVQGVQGLREEMREVTIASELMRGEHASLLRLSQVRQAELEQSNVELSIGVTERQREISRLKLMQEQGGREDSEASVREVDGLRQQMTSLGGDLEAERQRLQQQEKRMRQQECEAKASTINWEDEKQRLQATVQSLEGQITVLEDNRLKDKTNGRFNKRVIYNQEDNSSPSSSSVVLILTEEEELRADLTAQVQSLTKQMLKKQGDVLDLQAERAALKSMGQDLLARCSKAEQRLSSMRDLEGDEGEQNRIEGEGDYFDRGNSKGHYNYDTPPSSSSRGMGLQQRKSTNIQNHKVMADLEKLGVRPNAGVARAVNMIDSW
eukprot:CAMPEP_0119050878 /NCGR_PEP_ID=MMETSP1177-20130426/72402_1 /TAXON_ID=2985 /ORGANISM="Ochromonas sp, Strain CCMP1899" /LENGTH=633 /DNA_ID=CAMNT_0007029821 /DNA_START=11 /DNA_END=1909 /DNA_ORIENTATION=-